MSYLFKNLTLLLIAFSLLFSFQASAKSNLAAKNPAMFDLAESEESESENCEIENWKFLSQNDLNLKIFKNPSQQKNKNDPILSQNIAAIPTSPPNA